MKEFLKKELYSFRAVAAILARWLLLAVPTGLVLSLIHIYNVKIMSTDIERIKGVITPEDTVSRIYINFLLHGLQKLM